jgi:hypothetical protein
MKKPDRGPHYREKTGAVTLREIKRPDLIKDPYRVRGSYTKEDGRPGTFDAQNWREARDRADAINKQLEEGHAARTKSPKFERVWKEWIQVREEDHALGHLSTATLRGDKDTGRYLLAELGKKPIDKIVSIDVERWLKRLKSTKPGATKQCKIKLSQVFDYAVR